MAPCISPTELQAHQESVRRVQVADALIDYVQALVAHTRNSADWQAGLSPRAALALIASARAWAWLAGRDHVLPEDIQAVLPGVAGHRLRPAGDAPAAGSIGRLIEAVTIP
jgi:MoxR-like ATPase